MVSFLYLDSFRPKGLFLDSDLVSQSRKGSACSKLGPLQAPTLNWNRVWMLQACMRELEALRKYRPASACFLPFILAAESEFFDGLM